MGSNSKIFVAGHKGLVGSAIVRHLEAEGFTNIITADRRQVDLTNLNAVRMFFMLEQPEYVFLAAAKVLSISLAAALSSLAGACFTDGFSECMDENKNEIGIDGVKKLLINHQNSSLQKELENSTEEIRLKSLKKDYKETGIKANNDILDDDLTIIGIGH